MHFLKHIKIVVARSTVSTEGDIYAKLKKTLYRRKAGPELKIAARIVHYADALFFHYPHILFIAPYAVSRIGILVKKTELAEICYRRKPVPLIALVMLKSRL